MEKQVSKEQIGSIVTLLVAGKVPHDEAQAFIDKYKDAPSAKKRKAAEKPASIIQVWKERYPGRDQLFDELLAPLYGVRFAFRPAVADLEARLAAGTLDWMKATGVRLVRFTDIVRIQEISLTNPLHELIQGIGSEELWGDFNDWFFSVPWVPLEAEFKRILGAPLWMALEDCESRGFLVDTIYQLSQEIIEGRAETALKFKPLIELWLVGNFPAGLDEEGNLLILVAD